MVKKQDSKLCALFKTKAGILGEVIFQPFSISDLEVQDLLSSRNMNMQALLMAIDFLLCSSHGQMVHKYLLGAKEMIYDGEALILRKEHALTNIELVGIPGLPQQSKTPCLGQSCLVFVFVSVLPECFQNSTCISGCEHLESMCSVFSFLDFL